MLFFFYLCIQFQCYFLYILSIFWKITYERRLKEISYWKNSHFSQQQKKCFLKCFKPIRLDTKVYIFYATSSARLFTATIQYGIRIKVTIRNNNRTNKKCSSGWAYFSPFARFLPQNVAHIEFVDHELKIRRKWESERNRNRSLTYWDMFTIYFDFSFLSTVSVENGAHHVEAKCFTDREIFCRVCECVVKLMRTLVVIIKLNRRTELHKRQLKRPNNPSNQIESTMAPSFHTGAFNVI